MDKNPHVGVLGTKCRFIWHKKCPPPATLYNIPPKLQLSFSDIKRELLFYGCPICHSSVFIRKSILDKYGYYSKSAERSEDCELWLRLADKTILEIMDDILVYYTIHDESITSVNYNKCIAKYEYIKLKFQSKLLNIHTKNIYKIKLKRYLKRKLTPHELKLIIRYYMQINKIPGMMRKNLILSECKDAILNTEKLFLRPDCAFNFNLALLVCNKYISKILLKKFI